MMAGEPLNLENNGRCLFCKRIPAPSKPLERHPLRTFFQYLRMRKVPFEINGAAGAAFSTVDFDSSEVMGSLCKGCGNHVESFLKLKDGMESTMESCLANIQDDLEVGIERNEVGSEYPIREGTIMMKALERLRMTKPCLDSQNVQSSEMAEVEMNTVDSDTNTVNPGPSQPSCQQKTSEESVKEKDAQTSVFAELLAKIKSLEEKVEKLQARDLPQNSVNPDSSQLESGNGPVGGEPEGMPMDGCDNQNPDPRSSQPENSNGGEGEADEMQMADCVNSSSGSSQLENGSGGGGDAAEMQMDVEEASACHNVTLKRSHDTESPPSLEDVNESLGEAETPSTSKKRKLSESSNSNVKQSRNLMEMERANDRQWEARSRPCSVPELIALANHAYFLKELPQEEEKNLVQIEQLLLEWLSSCVAIYLPCLISTNLFPNTVETFECWEWIQAACKGEFVHSELNKLGAGGTDHFTLFVREQNCLVNMKKVSREKVRVMTFRGSLPNEMVMKGPIKATYPERLDVIPMSELLMSKCFANQLDYLHLRAVDIAMPAPHKDESGKIIKKGLEPSRPLIVSELLVALLCPNFEESKQWSWLKTEKKIRDSVNWKTSSKRGPWRRSGIWMAAKVLLNLSILDDVGKGNDDDAKIIYKATLLIFLSKVFNEMVRVEIKNWDILKQMMVKLARRSRKLQDLISSSTNVELIEKVKGQLSKVFSLVEGVHMHLTWQWQKLSDSLDIRNGINQVPTTEGVLQADSRHIIQDLNKYVNSNRQPPLQPKISTGQSSISDVNQEIKLPQLISRGLTTRGQDVHLNARSIWVFQVELFCRKLPEDLSYSCDDVHKLFMRYAEVAVYLFQEDPVAMSRAVVTLFILLRYLDRVAVEKHPLLKEYKTSVNPALLDKLLIPEKEEMKRIASIQSYFAKRNREALYPNWLESSSFSSTSFAVQYAQQNEEMQKLKKEILAEEEACSLNKRAEVDKAKEKYIAVQTQLSETSCQYTEALRGRKEHIRPCRKCSLSAKLSSVRYSVSEIQKTFPDSEVERDGIVFELNVPLEIAKLREATSVLIGELLAQSDSIFSPEQNEPQKYWVDFIKSQVYTKKPVEETGRLVRLGSTVKDKLALKYPKTGRKRRPHVMDATYETYDLDNGLNCIYFRLNKLRLGSPPQDLLTIKLSATCSLSSAPYENLQWALNEKRETENEVIARQYSCHQKLTLKEFVTFGSLRSGGRIQLRNLYIAMATRTLSLENEAVLSLIMQTLWELGGTDMDGRREIHVDLEDAQFASQFLKLLEKLVKENESSWGSPLTMISVVIIAIRIMELNDGILLYESVRLKVSNLLQRIRQMLKNWTTKVDNMLPDADTTQSMHLTKLLLVIEIASALTFNVSNPSVLNRYILRDSNDLCTWLETLSNLQRLVVRENVLQDLNLSKFLQNLLRLARSAIPLQLQDVTKLYVVQAVQKFASKKWHDAERFPKVVKYKTNPHIVLLKYETTVSEEYHYIIVDSLLGTFFVDGFPSGYLPDSTVRSQIFKSFFKTSKFRIQRDCTTFSTCDKYNGRHYKFFGDPDNLIIREMMDDGGGNFLELMPKHLFNGKVGFDLIENYTHWYNPVERTILFRKNLTKKAASVAEYKTEFVLKRVGNTATWQLTVGDLGQDDTKLISISSRTFKFITDILERIEKSQFVHLKLKDNEVKVDLRRLNLTFKLDNCDGKLYCDNYPGFYISHRASQSGGLGTLIGLQNGLVLEKPCVSDTTGFKRILLVPHGTLEVKAHPIHQQVTIMVSDGGLRHPPYFTYEVDTILKRLKPGNDQSAWLYLAALHASTASAMPDPFTNLTGVEMAMWILKSAFIFSCSPYNNECLQTFQQISKFSPSYSSYPSESQVTQSWSSEFGANSYAQYDGYRLAIQKLIRDSGRLKDLFLNTSPEDAIPEGDQSLTLRAYHLNINFYNRLAHVDPDLVKISGNNDDSIAPLSSSLDSSSPPEALHQLAQARRLQSLSTTASSILSLIMTSAPVSTTLSELASSNQLRDWLQIRRFRDNWFGLYNLILNGDNEVMHKLTFIFAGIIYTKSANIEQVLNLHNISVLARSTMFPPLGESTQEIFVPLSNLPVTDEISSILQSKSKSFPKSQEDYETEDEYVAARDKYNSDVSGLIAGATPKIEALFPVQNIDADTLSQLFDTFYSSHFDTSELEKEINEKLCFWYNNRNLTLFIEELEGKLNEEMAKVDIGQLPESTLSQGNLDVLLATWAPPEALQLQGASDLNFPDEHDLPSDFTEKRLRLIELEKSSTAEIDRVLYSNSLKSAFDKAGLFWRVRSPVALLRAEQEWLETIALKMGVLWAKLKRLSRIIFFQQNPEVYAVELEGELATEGCENWNPMEHTEWILLELELDITIRPVQVRVANHMMEMKDEEGKKCNGVMQLNMGEGKTSVIVPMIVSTLGKKEKVVCRVTVLNSIFETNSTLLRFAVGGLVNKRIYTVPCRRDFPITNYSASILKTYEECLAMGGVIITLPEYRLSFRLIMYNSLLKGDIDVGKNLYEIEDWLRKHARDIVDESDEIFSVKYQLTYTTGQQQKVDGGRLRWVVCRKLLQLLQEIAPNLFELYGSSKIELSKDKPHQFSHFRVLEEEGEFKRKLNEMVADGILAGKTDLLGMILNEEESGIVRTFLVKEDLSEDDHQKFMNLAGINEERRTILLIVSGYLRRDNLFTVFKKRWRVEFGVNPKGPRLLAVPFRAKDVPAERTEYGHADMAIALTYLCYYYSGLSDEQLVEVFKILGKEGEPESIYSSWIKQIPGVMVADSVKSYKGVNLDDFEQRLKYLFPILRRHKLVVDFWLENVAFTNECKQFPGKLVTNAWDLCFDLNHQITTGFSGTNDTSLLLPAQISQRDLDELKKTNDEVEVTLLGPENEYKRSLRMGVKCEEMLSYMKEDNLRVLIDTGALMLELGNEEVAKLWLEIDSSLECCVYFNEGNQLVVKARSSLHQQDQAKDELLTLSSFRDCMENCAVYLDDQHTRGVDLKLPKDFRACVTIGSGLRRDKLIQSCMRMRKLGKGQSVHFYLAHDVDTKMREEFIDLAFNNRAKITVEHILKWTKWNSKKFEEDGLVYWANAGKSYAQKLMAEQIHIETGLSQWEQFGQNCHEDEVITLNELYGTYLEQRALSEIVPTWFAKLEKKFKLQLQLQQNVPTDTFKDCLAKTILSKIVKKIQQSIPAKIYTTSMLEEEQERELEVEEDKEVRVERPSKETALVPMLHPNLVSFLFGDKFYSNNNVNRSGALNLSDVFNKTTFASGRVAQNEWGRNWYATQDFTQTIHLSENGVQDQFLRPITYFISRKLGKSYATEIILISHFEANCLIPFFRQPKTDKKSKTITLHMFSPRSIDGQDILCNLPGLQLPPNSFELNVTMLSPILIAAGNQYFDSKEEQTEFAEFLGLVLRPWGERGEEEAFRAGAISTTGFMDPKWRRRFGLSLMSKFLEDPVGLVRAIMKCRNERINDSCHVIRMLDQCAYVEM